MPTSLGLHLVNQILPEEHRGKGVLTKGKLNDILVDIAKKTPDLYPEMVTKLKRLGDELVTLEGISVGLDDVQPDKKTRDEKLAPHLAAFRAAKSDEARENALLGGQSAMLEYTKHHSGTMGEMARSGGRGGAAQLMKIVGAPVVSRDERDHVVPWFITRSYSEGLRPADAWVAGNEARINAIKSNISVVEPGDLAKILINNMSDQLITQDDCKTKNGVAMKTHDAHIVDRYLAHATGGLPAGALVTPSSLEALRKAGETVVVRSPMTCEAPHGLCQKCRGLDPAGHLYPVGTNVGVRSAQAMAEPLTQFALSAKHGGMLAKSTDDHKVDGIKGVRQFLEIPESFLYKATLAAHDGEVKKIEDAPQGGKYVFVNDTRHYLGPDLKVRVAVGHKVEAGDVLSNGIPKPDEVVHHKGLGAGRKYVVDALHGIYAEKGSELDKRHFETLARSLLNHVYVADLDEENDHGLLKGDVIDYNRYKAAIAGSRKTVPAAEAAGETLGDDVLHFTAGTRITPSVIGQLSRQGIHNISIADHGPTVEPVMRPATRNPLLQPDWMQRLAHRYLKETLLQGAHKGDTSDLHGTSPVPAYAAGTTFGQGTAGRY